MKILIKRINKNIELPKIIAKGDWIDLRAAENVHLYAPQSDTLKRRTVDGKQEKYRNVNFDSTLISLGIAVSVPKGFECIIAPRSSTLKKFGIVQGNSVGIVDHSYSSDKDVWKFLALALRETYIEEGDRICQFKVVLSQRATLLQKIKWLFSSKIKIVEVDSLPNKNERGGFGSTNK